MKFAVAAGGLWHAPQLIEGLHQLGHTVTLLSTQKCEGVEHIKLRPRALQRVSGLHRLFQLCAAKAFGMQIAHKIGDGAGFDAILVWSSFAKELLDRQPLPPVVVIRGSHHIRTQLNTIQSRLSFFDSMAIKREETEYRKAHFVTVPTHHIASDAEWLKGQAHVNVSPYGMSDVDNSRTHSMHRPSTLDTLKVLIVGEVSFRKGADRVDDYVKHQTRSDDFSWAGRNTFHLQNRPHLTLTGQLPRAEVMELTQQSDVFLSLSREEGMTRAGLDALAFGVPVLTTASAGLGHWISNFNCGIELNDDPTAEQIASGLADIASNWHFYSANALRAASSWSWRDHAAEIIEHIRSLGDQ